MASLIERNVHRSVAENNINLKHSEYSLAAIKKKTKTYFNKRK